MFNLQHGQSIPSLSALPPVALHHPVSSLHNVCPLPSFPGGSKTSFDQKTYTTQQLSENDDSPSFLVRLKVNTQKLALSIISTNPII